LGDYCTRAEVKARLQDISTDYDALIDTLKDQASRDIERLTGQTFEPVTGSTRTFDGSGTCRLILPWSSPIVTVTTLKVRTGGEGSTQVTVPSSDYYLEPANRLAVEPARWIELGSGISSGVTVFTSGKRTVEILGDWIRAAIPSDINDICIDMTIQALRERGRGAPNLAAALGDDDVGPRGMGARTAAILKAHGWQQGIYVS
jgi:hypothetical protein